MSRATRLSRPRCCRLHTARRGMLSGGPQGSISHSYYTALAMNAARNSRCPVQADISADPNFPAELLRHFFVDYAQRL